MCAGALPTHRMVLGFGEVSVGFTASTVNAQRAAVTLCGPNQR
jgi:hypothetical protein